MRDNKVAEHIKNLDLTEEQAHNFIKAVMIATTRDLQVDFNKNTGRRVDKVLEKLDQEEALLENR